MTSTIFANNASTTLGSAVSSTATTITVASGTGNSFPAPAPGQYFMATLSASSTGLPNEIVKVIARVGDTMTVVRGQEGTTEQSWAVGNTFANFVTAGFLNSLADSTTVQAQAGNFAADSGTANAGVVTLTPAPANLTALIGVPIRVKKGGANSTGAYTLNVNTFGAVPVLIGGSALEGGELIANEIYEVIYDGAEFNLISNPGTLHGDRIAASSIANAALANVPSLTLKGNLSGGTAAPYDVPLLALAEMLDIGTGIFGNPGEFSIPLIVGGVLTTGIIKFGYGIASSGTFINFSPSFPNACLAVSVSDSGNNPLAWGADKTTYAVNGFVIHNYTNVSGSYIYIAFGY